MRLSTAPRFGWKMSLIFLIREVLLPDAAFDLVSREFTMAAFGFVIVAAFDLADGADMKAVWLHSVGDFEGEIDPLAARRGAGPQFDEFGGVARQVAVCRHRLRLGLCQRGAGQQRRHHTQANCVPPVHASPPV